MLFLEFLPKRVCSQIYYSPTEPLLATTLRRLIALDPVRMLRNATDSRQSVKMFPFLWAAFKRNNLHANSFVVLAAVQPSAQRLSTQQE